MLSVRRTAAVACLLIAAAPSVSALGFGSTSNATVLGGTLDFSVAVTAAADEPLPTECVSAEVVAGESLVPAGSVRVRVERAGDSGSRLIRVLSSARIDEPVVTVTLTLGCPRSWTRSFVVFVDPAVTVLPPTLAALQAPLPAALPASPSPVTVAPAARRIDAGPAAASASAAAPAAATPAASSGAASGPAADAQAGDLSALAPAATLPEPVRAELAPAAAPSPEKAAVRSDAPKPKQKPKPTVVAKRPAPNAAPRLRLDPAPAAATKLEPKPAQPAVVALPGGAALSAVVSPLAASTPALVAAPETVSADAAASAAGSLERQTATEAERLRLMEESLNLLRNDNQATQKTIAGLELSLRQAEGSRYANPLVLALAALVCMLTLAVVLLLWRLSALRKDTAWWAAGRAGAGSEPKPRPVDDSADVEPPGLVRAPVVVTEPQAPAAPAEPTASDAAWAANPSGAARSYENTQPMMLGEREPRGGVAFEELIDLEQQVDFFVVLGQDEAAIDLLIDHLRESDGASPIPYLKLLEIYRRRDEREPYEETRERFNLRFHAYAPEWDAHTASGRCIEDYPEVLLDIQNAWRRLPAAKSLLESLLFRGGSSGATFDLSAYEELLLLFSVVRDLTEDDDALPSVDLLLPLDGEGLSEQTFVDSMTATMPVELYAGPDSQMGQTLDLDLGGNLPALDIERPKSSQ